VVWGHLKIAERAGLWAVPSSLALGAGGTSHKSHVVTRVPPRRNGGSQASVSFCGYLKLLMRKDVCEDPKLSTRSIYGPAVPSTLEGSVYGETKPIPLTNLHVCHEFPCKCGIWNGPG
jgi:hypothetical protein